ncbi:hypothetical protein QW180_14490 [Vibrio sinaloensis]|nr:hypothetical protein [Vibrio sinaloensis]
MVVSQSQDDDFTQRLTGAIQSAGYHAEIIDQPETQQEKASTATSRTPVLL